MMVDPPIEHTEHRPRRDRDRPPILYPRVDHVASSGPPPAEPEPDPS